MELLMAANLKVIDTGMATATANTDRQKALDAALAQIDRAFGKGSAMRLGAKETMQVETISTGSLGLDIALGVGGLPRGRVIEVYGPESSGKTTLALHVIAEAQRAAAPRRSSTPSMRSTRSMPRSWASTSTS
jgi:recombination protein RecA